MMTVVARALLEKRSPWHSYVRQIIHSQAFEFLIHINSTLHPHCEVCKRTIDRFEWRSRSVQTDICPRRLP